MLAQCWHYCTTQFYSIQYSRVSCEHKLQTRPAPSRAPSPCHCSTAVARARARRGRDAARDGVELREANDALEEKLEASLRLQAMAEARAETAAEALESLRMSSRQAKEVDDERISELEERLAVAEGLHADASRQVTEKSQEVEKMNSSSKALGDRQTLLELLYTLIVRVLGLFRRQPTSFQSFSRRLRPGFGHGLQS